MGMSKAARMLMVNHSKSDDHNDNNYDDYGRDKNNKENRKSHENNKIRAGGTFWMDSPHKEVKLNHDTAEKWVENMESRDGTKGGKWTYDQTTQVMKQKGFECDPVDFYVAMNAIWSDYGKTLTKHGITAPEVYAELAYDWVKDPDAYKDKAARYYEYIVK